MQSISVKNGQKQSSSVLCDPFLSCSTSFGFSFLAGLSMPLAGNPDEVATSASFSLSDANSCEPPIVSYRVHGSRRQDICFVFSRHLRSLTRLFCVCFLKSCRSPRSRECRAPRNPACARFQRRSRHSPPIITLSRSVVLR